MTDAVLALGSVDWEAKLVSALSHPMIGLHVQRRCVDGVDVRAAIRTVSADIVLVSDHTLRIDADCVNDVQSHGIRLIALSQTPEQWHDLGVTDVVRIDETEPLACLQTLTHVIRHSDDEAPENTDSVGQGIAVVGFGGGAGRSGTARETAFALSQEFNESRILLADADMYGPSLAQELGDDDLNYGILSACRAHENRKLDSATLGEHVTPVLGNLDLMAGLSRSSRWNDLRIPALRGTWNTALDAYDFVVTDVGPVIEMDASIAVETALPRRHAAMLTALDSASTILLTTRADAVGVTRLIQGVIDTEAVLSDKNIHVVVCGVHNTGHGREIEKSIVRFAGLDCVHLVPYRSDSFAKALEHNTFASLLDKSVANTFHLIAQEIGASQSDVRQTQQLVQANNDALTGITKRPRLRRAA